MNTTTITIRKGSEQEFLAFVKRQNRRAERLGVQPLTITRLNEHIVAGSEVIHNAGDAYANDVTRPVNYACVDYKIDGGPAITLNGWSFVAVVESSDAGNLFLGLPDLVNSVPVAFRTSGSKCDHCQSVRQRKATYIVKHTDGTFKQVGSTCIKDFLGGESVAAWEFNGTIWTVLKDWADEDMGSGGMRSDRAWSLVEMLQMSAAWTEKHGYLSRTKADLECKEATVDAIHEYLMPPAPGVSRQPFPEITPAHIELAGKVVQWMAVGGDGNGYRDNLKVLAGNGYCTERGLGLAVSSVAAYHRELAKLAENAEDRKSVHIGTVGKREVFEVTVDRVIVSEGNYGTTGIHLMHDTAGNKLVWFASGSWLTAGETVKVKATVKAHDERKGVKQTILSRAVKA